MSTNREVRYPTKKGPPSIRSRKLHFFDDDNNDGARLPANIVSRMFEKNMAPIIGGGVGFGASLTAFPGWSITTGGTADALVDHTLGGILMTAASDSDFDMTLDSVMTVTPTTDKWYSMLARIQASADDGIGFKLGLTTGAGAAALPFGTNYTDVVAISKEIADATVVGTCRGNSGTAANSGDLGDIADATEVEVGFCFYLHATKPQGFWYYKTLTADAPTVTAFTANQKTQVAAILTSPPTMYWTIHITGVTGTNPTLAVTSFLAGGDR